MTPIKYWSNFSIVASMIANLRSNLPILVLGLVEIRFIVIVLLDWCEQHATRFALLTFEIVDGSFSDTPSFVK